MDSRVQRFLSHVMAHLAGGLYDVVKLCGMAFKWTVNKPMECDFTFNLEKKYHLKQSYYKTRAEVDGTPSQIPAF